MLTLVNQAPKILGIVFERCGSHFCLRVTGKKLDTVRMRCGEIVKATAEKDVRYKQVAKVVWDVCCILCSGTDRAVIELLRPVFPMLVKKNFENTIQSKSRVSSRILISAVQKIQLLLEHYEPTYIGKGTATRSRAWLNTDASSRGSGSKGPREGATVLSEEGALLYTYTDDLPPGRSIGYYEAI